MEKGLKSNRADEKVRIYPQTPQGGLFNLRVFNKSKSPLGDLGVS